MQITETLSEGLRREFRVVIAAEAVEKEIEGQLENIGRRTRLPGFRPGKVPLSVLRQRFGPSVIPEAIDHLVHHGIHHVLSDSGVRPALEPEVEVEPYTQGKSLSYRMRVDILPEIEPLDLSGIEVEKLDAEVGEAEIEQAIERMALAAKRFVPVTEPRAAQSGDLVIADYVGRLDGKEIEQGKAEGRAIEIGSGTFPPEFEERLIGARPGDRLDIQVVVPEGRGDPRWTGKKIDFEVHVQQLRERAPVEINDDFAREAGAADLEAMKAMIRKQLGEEFESESKLRLRQRLFDALAQRADFVLPERLVENEFESIWSRMEQQRRVNEGEAGSKGKDEDESEDEAALRTEYRAIAERRVRLGLLLSDIGSRNKIELSDDEVEQELLEKARTMPGQEREFLEYYRKNPQALASFRAPMFEAKVVDFILKKVKITTRSVTPTELFKEEEGNPMAALKAKSKKAAKKTTTKKPAAKKPAAKKTTAKKTAAKKPAAKKTTVKKTTVKKTTVKKTTAKKPAAKKTAAKKTTAKKTAAKKTTAKKTTAKKPAAKKTAAKKPAAKKTTAKKPSAKKTTAKKPAAKKTAAKKKPAAKKTAAKKKPAARKKK